MKLGATTERSRQYLKQLKGVGIFKVLAMAASFLIMPIMIKYLGVTEYGVWSTILSILSWVVMFDLGIGNGLRNRVSESIAKNKMENVKIYISTGYIAITAFAICFCLIFFIASEYIPWGRVFNTVSVDSDELKFTVDISMFFILVNFVFSIINQIFNAVQKTELVIMNQFYANLLALLLTFALYRYAESSIGYLAIVYGLSIFISNLIFTIWFYHSNPQFSPDIRKFSKSKIVDILGLGSQFFIIQIAVVVLFTTDRLIITQLLGPEYIAAYDVVFKLFSAITILHGIIISPLWNSYSDAYHREDYEWMSRMVKKQCVIFLGLSLLIIVVYVLSDLIIKYWVGQIPYLSNELIVALAFFSLVMIWNNVFSVFLNGINETRLQVKTAIVAALINIPLSMFFVKYFNMGVEGIVLGSVISLLIFSVFGPFEVYNILYRLKNDKACKYSSSGL
jgi:O-antigen/teichoic acid export membrane protein